jgi:hypothetical protein
VVVESEGSAQGGVEEIGGGGGSEGSDEEEEEGGGGKTAVRGGRGMAKRRADLAFLGDESESE